MKHHIFAYPVVTLGAALLTALAPNLALAEQAAPATTNVTSGAATAVHVLTVGDGSMMEFKVDHALHAADFKSISIQFGAEMEGLQSKAPALVAIDKIVIPFKSFDSGNASRDSNALDVMKAYDHPNLVFDPYDAIVTVTRQSEAELIADITLIGDISIAGVTKKEFKIPGVLTSDYKTFTVEGKFIIKLGDHNIEPPSLMFVEVDSNIPVKYLLKGKVEAAK